MAKTSLHPFMEAAGVKDEKSFYKKFPTEESYFKHMQMGGGVMPQFMPPLYPTGQPVRIQQPEMAMGGHLNNGMYWDGTKMVKHQGSGTYSSQTGTYFQYGGLRAGNQYPQYTDNPVPFPAKYGGLRAGNEYPQYWDNAVPFPAEYGGYPDVMSYGGLRAGNEYPQYVDNPVPFPAEMGGHMDSDIDIPEFAKGGIHIKPSHVGRFTAYKKRTGKTTEEALHSKDPKVRAMANFAKNAAKWKHEYGGTANPFHPIHEYATGGNFAPGEPDPNYDPGIAPQQAPPPYMPTNTGVIPDQQQQPAAWRANMSDAQANQNINYGAGSTEAYDPNTGNTDNGPGSVNGMNKQRRGNRAGEIAGAGTNLLGAAMLTGQYLENQHYQKDQAAWQRQHGLTDSGPKFNNPFSHGTNAPTTYSQTPSMMYSQYGGGTKYSQMGGYTKDSIHEMDDETVQKLTRMGYKLQKA